jgi:hypothetical protein
MQDLTTGSRHLLKTTSFMLLLKREFKLRLRFVPEPAAQGNASVPTLP